MKFQEYLMEERIENADKKTIMKYIKKPPKREDSYTLRSFSKNYMEDERKIDVRPLKGKMEGVEFSYNSDFDELTFFLTTTVDSMDDYDFKVDYERPINTTNFIIYRV